MSALAAEPTFRALVADPEPVRPPRVASRSERRAAQRAARRAAHRAMLRAARERVGSRSPLRSAPAPGGRASGPLARGAAVAVTAGLLVGGGLGATGAAGQAPGWTGVAGTITPFSAERATSAHGARLAAQVDAAAEVSRAESLAVATAALAAAAAVGPLTTQVSAAEVPTALGAAVERLAVLVQAARPADGARMRAEVPLPPARVTTAPAVPAPAAPEAQPAQEDEATDAPEDGATGATLGDVVQVVEDAAATQALRDSLADVAAADEALADNPLVRVPSADLRPDDADDADDADSADTDGVPADDEVLGTEPLTTEPLSTELPTTEPPTTEPLATEPLTTDPLTTDPEAAAAAPPPDGDVVPPAGDVPADGADPTAPPEPATDPAAVDPDADPRELTAALAEAAGQVFRLSMEVESLSGAAERDETVARAAALQQLESTATTADAVTSAVEELEPLEPLTEEEKRARAALEEAATARREDVSDADDPVATTVRSRARLRADVPAGVTALTQRWQNGRIPAEELCAVQFAPRHRLQCDAAAALVRLNEAHREEFGTDLALVSSYRPFDVQVSLKATKGGLAATPGTSNHGWGLAIDLGGIGGLGEFDKPGYRWLKENADAYGWHHPRVMEPGGSGPQEPWHWEFGTA